MKRLDIEEGAERVRIFSARRRLRFRCGLALAENPTYTTSSPRTWLPLRSRPRPSAVSLWWAQERYLVGNVFLAALPPLRPAFGIRVPLRRRGNAATANRCSRNCLDRLSLQPREHRRRAKGMVVSSFRMWAMDPGGAQHDIE